MQMIQILHAPPQLPQSEGAKPRRTEVVAYYMETPDIPKSVKIKFLETAVNVVSTLPTGCRCALCS